jgi:hypothetical protein
MMTQGGGQRSGDRSVDVAASSSTPALVLGVLGLAAGFTLALYPQAILLGAVALALDVPAERQAVGRRRTGVWLGTAAMVIGVFGLMHGGVFEDEGRRHDLFVDSAPLPAADDFWPVGATATTDRIVVTLHQVTDPFTTDEPIDPRSGHRLVATAIELENLAPTHRTFDISRHMRLVEDRNGALHAADVSLVLPDPAADADLAPFEPRRNVVVFEVPADAIDLKLYVQGDDEPGIWFDLDHEG